MDGSPFRERRFAPADVRRILRRAAEVAERDAATAAAERPLTQEEIERLGGELGLPRTAIRRAIAGDTSTAGEAPEPFGGARRIAFEDEIDGELPASRHDDVVDAIQAATGDVGRAQVVGRMVSWTPAPAMGSQPRQLSVSVRSRDGKTRVRIEEAFSQLFLGLHLGLGLGLGLGGGFGVAFPIGLAMRSPLFGIALWLVVEIASLTLAQVVYRGILRRRTRELTALRARLGEVIVEAIAVKQAGARVRIGARDAEAEAEVETEAEAEAEAEPSAGEKRSLER